MLQSGNFFSHSLPSADSGKADVKLLAKVTALSTSKQLSRSNPALESVGMLNDHPSMTIAVFVLDTKQQQPLTTTTIIGSGNISGFITLFDGSFCCGLHAI